MTLKRRAEHAGFSTRGIDRDARPSRRRRRNAEEQLDWAPPKASCTCSEEGFWWCAIHAEQIDWLQNQEAETGNEGVDGLHPEEA